MRSGLFETDRFIDFAAALAVKFLSVLLCQWYGDRIKILIGHFVPYNDFLCEDFFSRRRISEKAASSPLSASIRRSRSIMSEVSG